MNYEDLRKAIHNAPLTWFPALLTLVVEQCVKRRVFMPGGMQRAIDKAADKANAAVFENNL